MATFNSDGAAIIFGATVLERASMALLGLGAVRWRLVG